MRELDGSHGHLRHLDRISFLLAYMLETLNSSSFRATDSSVKTIMSIPTALNDTKIGCVNSHFGYKTFFPYSNLATPAPPKRTFDFIVKIGVVGMHRSGKSSIIQRLLHDKFDKGSVKRTVSIDFHAHRIILEDGRICVVHLLDMGEKRFFDHAKRYLSRCHGFFIVLDLLADGQIEETRHWVRLLKSTDAPGSTNIDLVGNKSDQDSSRWKFDLAALDAVASEQGLVGNCWLVSAKSGRGVATIVRSMADRVVNVSSTGEFLTRSRFYKVADEYLVSSEDPMFGNEEEEYRRIIQYPLDLELPKGRRCLLM